MGRQFPLPVNENTSNSERGVEVILAEALSPSYSSSWLPSSESYTIRYRLRVIDGFRTSQLSEKGFEKAVGPKLGKPVDINLYLRISSFLHFWLSVIRMAI